MKWQFWATVKLALIFTAGAMFSSSWSAKLWSAAFIFFAVSVAIASSVLTSVERERRRASEESARNVYDAHARDYGGR